MKVEEGDPHDGVESNMGEEVVQGAKEEEAVQVVQHAKEHCVVGVDGTEGADVAEGIVDAENKKGEGAKGVEGA